MKSTLIAIAAALVGLALGWMLRSEPEVPPAERAVFRLIRPYRVGV